MVPSTITKWVGDCGGISTAFGEILVLAMSVVVVSSAGLLWLNFATPGEKVRLELVGSNGKICIYDVAGILDCRKVRIILQDENFTKIEEFGFDENSSRFVGIVNGWSSNEVFVFLNPGDYVVLNVTPGVYLVTVGDDRSVLVQGVVRC